MFYAKELKIYTKAEGEPLQFKEGVYVTEICIVEGTPGSQYGGCVEV